MSANTSTPNTANSPNTARPRGEITRLLQQASSGNRASFNELVPIVYDELHSIANARLRIEPSGHTLTPTALVHEAYLQLVGQVRTEWHSRSHFFAVAALAMRRILINYAKDVNATFDRVKRRSATLQSDSALIDLIYASPERLRALTAIQGVPVPLLAAARLAGKVTFNPRFAGCLALMLQVSRF